MVPVDLVEECIPMKVTLLGTGCPQCHTKRDGPANLVRHGSVSVLVDCG